MIELKLKNGKVLSYDDSAQDSSKILIDGKSTNLFEPVFIPNGDDEPTFFGFVESATGTVYDVYGGTSKITNENDIKL